MAKRPNKGLGRGIEALFSADLIEEDLMEETKDQELEEKEATESTSPVSAKTEETSGEQVARINLSEIRANPYQPRSSFDEEKLKELAESIQLNGVFQPIIVRRSAIKGYDLVAGERRLRASELAGLDSIPAIVRDYEDNDMLEIAIIENLQREDLSPIDEALAYQTLMNHLHLTQEQVSHQVGKSRSYVANFLRLLALPANIQDLVHQGDLSVGHGRALLAVENEDIRQKLVKEILKKGMSVRDLEERIRQLSGEKTKTKTKESQPRSPYLVAFEDRLMDKFGTNVSIVPKGDSGKIQIDYLSHDDLQRILDLLEIHLDED